MQKTACGLVIAGVIAELLCQPAQCQTPAPRNTSVSVNYVYAASLGFGGYSLSGLTANVYTLPLSYTLRDILRPGWSLKLLMPVQVGIYQFDGSFQGRGFSIGQQSVTAVPGAELQIPLTDNFVVRPFAQGGFDRQGRH